ncbi:cation diffusion facilitator family transporter [Gracilinema caldarium DSM 7334]|uniref:Cation diffusion facilitator family transporter n=2 Tax=Gracilinema caldarium TaxID=215591 RepID=F8EZF0_GRAC1|nr:cation diffusion facilitator family transporter [Gracilinema caldarium DSM 7334]
MNATKARLIKTASIIAMAGNALLALLKIIIGLIAGSLAVVGDGIDSSTDVFIALMSLIVAGIIAQPADAEHPWGHGRAETIATTILAFILFFAGGQLIIHALTNLFSGTSPDIPSPLALGVTLFSILGKLGLAWSQYYFGKKAGSAMLQANGKNMVGDVVISSGVLVGVGLSIVLHQGIIDPIIASLVGLWVIRSAVSIFLEANMELMDGSSDTAIYTAVFNAVRSVPGTINPHRTRMRRIAGLWDIDIDIEVDPEMKVRDAHHIANQVERAIKNSVEGVYDIVVHIEPAGEEDKHEKEQYGLRESEL